MQVTETLNEGLKRGYNIVVSAIELDEKIVGKLVEAQRDFEMKGFRQGKVPITLLKKKFGQRLLNEVLQASIDGAIKKHFEDSGDRSVYQPDVKIAKKDWKEGDDVHVELSYEAMPEIPEVDLTSIELEKLVVKVDDATIEMELNKLAKTIQKFKLRCKDSKAEDGDQIVFDFIGKVDGEEFEAGSGEDFSMVLGSHSFIHGIDEQLVGAKAEEEKDVYVTFPVDYFVEHLAGKDAVLTCTIKEVKEPVATEVDDELAKKFDAEDLADLKSQIAENLKADYSNAAHIIMKRALFDVLIEKVSFDLPQSMVESEARRIAHASGYMKNPDGKDYGHHPVEPTDEQKKLAERRVRLGLLMGELGRRAELEVTGAEKKPAVMNPARQHPGQELQHNEPVQHHDQLKQLLMVEKVGDYILELAQVTVKEVMRDDLIKAIEATGEN